MPKTSNVVGSHKTAVYTDSDGSLCVKYHNTVVWKRAPNGVVTLNNGGYQTVTTKRRMNEAFRQYVANPWGVFQKKGEWYISRYLGDGVRTEPLPYSNGMQVVS